MLRRACAVTSRRRSYPTLKNGSAGRSSARRNSSANCDSASAPRCLWRHCRGHIAPSIGRPYRIYSNRPWRKRNATGKCCGRMSYTPIACRRLRARSACIQQASAESLQQCGERPAIVTNVEKRGLSPNQQNVEKRGLAPNQHLLRDGIRSKQLTSSLQCRRRLRGQRHALAGCRMRKLQPLGMEQVAAIARQAGMVLQSAARFI
jgi:hypothetical protein